ncbi:hypothetical protein ACIP1U_10305 [Cupriavidus sp. NPDC089707]|uniref:hypothetical protein n=1 Tax=Cupriavidus sp. NPDC089707 TaxID=3363963 RepID=UPI0038117122
MELSEKNEAWLMRAQWIVRVLVTGGIGLKLAYLVGRAYTEAYLTSLRVDPVLFAFADGELYVAAYIAVAYGLAGWVNFMMGSVLPLISLFAVVSLIWFAPSLVRWLAQVLERSSRIKKIVHLGGKFDKFAMWIGANAFAVSVFLYLPLILALVLVAIPRIGNFGGTRAAEEKIKVLSQGCLEAAKKKEYCYRLIDGGKEVAVGFPVIQGNGRLALWLHEDVSIEEIGSRSLKLWRPEEDTAKLIAP